MLLTCPTEFNEAHRTCIDTQYGLVSIWTWMHKETARILEFGRKERPQRKAEVIVGDFGKHRKGSESDKRKHDGYDSVWLWVDIPPGYVGK